MIPESAPCRSSCLGGPDQENAWASWGIYTSNAHHGCLSNLSEQYPVPFRRPFLAELLFGDLLSSAIQELISLRADQEHVLRKSLAAAHQSREL